MKGINNYFERIKDPTKEIIDFNYLNICLYYISININKINI